jgi:serine/threonine protein kinase
MQSEITTDLGSHAATAAAQTSSAPRQLSSPALALSSTGKVTSDRVERTGTRFEPCTAGHRTAVPCCNPRSKRPTVCIDGYRLDRYVGGGGFADVFQVTTALGASLAMKVLLGDLAADAEQLARFRAEPRLMNAVRHPDVPRAFAEGVTPGGRPYFVMDWLGGETLQARAERLGGRLSVREVERIGLWLAGVLAAVHEAGVLHLDVKPDNLLATDDGRLALADFGIARRRSELGDGTDVGGTPMFLAPEQLRGTGLGPWTDVRALGATLFVLLTGRPVCATPASRTLLGQLHAPARPLLSVLPSAPPYLARLVDRCLSPEPAARPTTREIAQELLFARMRAARAGGGRS